MWEIVSLVALAALVVTGGAWLHAGRPDRLASMVVEKADLPNDAVHWMLPPAYRPPSSWWWAASLILFAVSFWAGLPQHSPHVAAARPIGAFILGVGIASLIRSGARRDTVSIRMRGGGVSIAPTLAEFADAAERFAATVHVTEVADHRLAPSGLAAWLRELSWNRPNMTWEAFQNYHTPFEVARILEERFVLGHTDGWAVGRWLERPECALYESSTEAQRVAMLNRARSAFFRAKDGVVWVNNQDSTTEETVRQVVAELREWRPVPGSG